MEKKEICDKKYLDNIKELMSWGIDDVIVQSIIKGIKTKKNILIVGAVAKGKTKLLNLLLNITNKNEKFCYLYNSSGEKYNDYSMNVEHQSRIEYHINLINKDYHAIEEGILKSSQEFLEKSNFYVIDDIYQDDLVEIVKQLKKSFYKGTISTCFLRNIDDLEFIDVFLKSYFDIIILLEGYKKIKGVFSTHK